MDNSEFSEPSPVCAISMTRVDSSTQPIVPMPQSSSTKPVVAMSHPLDGSQFHEVIDEQIWSELPPTPEEQQPRRSQDLPPPAVLNPHPADPLISVGES